jgi:hypothetical protein
MEIERGAVIVTTADADFVGSLSDAAVTVTWLGGLLAGAVYVVEAPLAVELGETDPHDEVEHDTFHVTPCPFESFVTVAMIALLPPGSKLTDAGETLTLITRGGVDTLPHPQTPAINTAAKEAHFAVPLLLDPMACSFWLRALSGPHHL